GSPRRDDLPREGGHDDGRGHPRDGIRPQGRRSRAVHGRRPHHRGHRSRDLLHRTEIRSRQGLPRQDPQSLTFPRIRRAARPAGRSSEPHRRYSMKLSRSIRLGIGAVAVAVVATACGGDETRSVSQSAENGTLTVGIKFDQPGLGLRNPDGSFSGFDVEVAEYVAGQLGVPPENITFKEAPSAQRETLIQNGEVDYVVATYSITDARKEKVDFAGPYFIAGQSLLVRADETEITGPETLSGGKRLCSVAGSTPAQNVKDNYAQDVQLQEFDTYSLCVEALRNGAVDAVTTDDIILAGYAAQSPGDFKVV